MSTIPPITFDCPGCCAPPCAPADLECRTRAATLKMCGFAEYADPTVPPIFYRKRAVTGTMYIGRFPDNACAYNPGTGGIGGSVTMTGTRGSGTNATVTASVTNLVKVSSTQIKATVQFNWNPGSTVDRPNVGLNAGSTPGAANVWTETIGVPTTGVHTQDIILTASSTPSTFILWVNIWYAFSGNAHSATDYTLYTWSLTVTLDSMRDNWDLEQEYNSACVLGTNHDNTQRHHEDIGPYPLTSGGTLTTAPGSTAYGSSHVTTALTPTTKTVTGKAVCVADSPGWLKHSGTVTETLSVPSTESEAISKFHTDVAFGSWHSVPGIGCADGSVCCKSLWEVRTTDEFIYGDAEFRVTGAGLLPSTAYTVNVSIYRRAFGVGSFVLYSTLTYGVTTDGTGAFSMTDDVPNDEGYETYACVPCVTVG